MMKTPHRRAEWYNGRAQASEEVGLPLSLGDGAVRQKFRPRLLLRVPPDGDRDE